MIAQKIANQLNVKKGDTITFTRTGKPAKKVKVSGITTNYIGVFAYMSRGRTPGPSAGSQRKTHCS
nr:hypothetical protein [Lacticaseibacillus camelliae]